MTETDAWVGLRAHYPLNGVPATNAADVNFGPWVRSWRESMCRSLQWVKRSITVKPLQREERSLRAFSIGKQTRNLPGFGRNGAG